MKLNKTWAKALMEIRDEEGVLLRYLESLDLSPDHRILDVGCGYGEKMKLLSSAGYNVLGVDVNPAMVQANRQSGMNCLSAEDFEESEDSCDVILMSHVIEHFSPKELLVFIDKYLDRLKSGGHLIIITPLQSPHFYWDFDHVKPYHPFGINMVFGGKEKQVQYYSEHELELKDIWFRRVPIQLYFFPGLYLKKYSRIPRIINFLLTILFRVSFKVIGKTEAWLGLYQKTS